MIGYRKQLEIVRRYTGDAFSPARGYRANKIPSFGQKMAVLKYYQKIRELTGTATVTYTPKRGEKTEAFKFTGQNGYRKFTKAIIRKLDEQSKLTFRYDRKRPKGSRFVVIDRKTGREFYHIPAHLFISDDYEDDFLEWIAQYYELSVDIDHDDEDIEAAQDEAREQLLQDAQDIIDTSPEDVIRQHYYSYLIEKYTNDAQFFLINAGETFMWGAGGQRDQITAKLAQIFRNYSETQFDAHDKNSSYYGNWFRGVTGFTTRFQVLPAIGQALKKQKEYRAKWKMSQDRRYRELKNGLLGVFVDGQLTETIVQTWRKDLG